MLPGYSLYIYNELESNYAGLIILAKQTAKATFDANIFLNNFDGAVAAAAPGDEERRYSVGHYANNWGRFVPLCFDCEDRSCNGCQKMPPVRDVEKAEKSIKEHVKEAIDGN